MSQPDDLDALLGARLASRVKELRGTRSQRLIARQGRIPSPTTIRDIEGEEIARPSLRLALELVEGLGLGTIEELLGEVPSQRFMSELRAELDEGDNGSAATA